MLESFTPQQKLEIFELLRDISLQSSKTIYVSESYEYSVIDADEFNRLCREGADKAEEEFEVEMMEEDDYEYDDRDRYWDEY